MRIASETCSSSNNATATATATEIEQMHDGIFDSTRGFSLTVFVLMFYAIRNDSFPSKICGRSFDEEMEWLRGLKIACDRFNSYCSVKICPKP